jgi:hypothetical protein
MDPNTNHPNHPINMWHNANVGMLQYVGELHHHIEVQGHALANTQRNLDSLLQDHTHLWQTVDWLQRVRITLWDRLTRTEASLREANADVEELLAEPRTVRRQMGTNTDHTATDASTQTDPETAELPLTVAVMYCGQDASTSTGLESRDVGTTTNAYTAVWARLAGKTAQKSRKRALYDGRFNLDLRYIKRESFVRMAGRAVQKARKDLLLAESNTKRVCKNWRRLKLHLAITDRQRIEMRWAKMAILVFRFADFAQEKNEDDKKATLFWECLPTEIKTETALKRLLICSKTWHMIQKTYLREMQELPSFKRQNLAMQTLPAKIKVFFLELFDIIHKTVTQRKTTPGHDIQEEYTAVVGGMVELKLSGLAVVENNGTILAFVIPGYEERSTSLIRFQVTTNIIADIYDAGFDKIVALYEQNFPDFMTAARTEYNQRSTENRVLFLARLESLLTSRFGRRFHIGGLKVSEKGLPQIVIQARMMFADLRVIFAKKWETVCTVYEALEKLHTRFFDRMLHDEILATEERLGVKYNTTGIYLNQERRA